MFEQTNPSPVWDVFSSGASSRKMGVPGQEAAVSSGAVVVAVETPSFASVAAVHSSSTQLPSKKQACRLPCSLGHWKHLLFPLSFAGENSSREVIKALLRDLRREGGTAASIESLTNGDCNGMGFISCSS